MMMTLEEEKVESKIECPKCGKLNPLDTVRCIRCAAIIKRPEIYAAGEAKEVTNG